MERGVEGVRGDGKREWNAMVQEGRGRKEKGMERKEQNGMGMR